MHFPEVLRRWRVVVPAVVLAGAGLTIGARNLDSQARSTTPAVLTTAASAANTNAPLETASYADAVARALPAVVTLQVEKRGERTSSMQIPEEFRRFFGPNMVPSPDGPVPFQEGLGSGVIVTGDGTILTNNHVVEGAEHLTVVLSDGREFTGKVVGTDPPTDLAVVDIEGNNLPTLPLADSNRTRVGDVVLAVGNPLGVGQTVTMGIISAKGRSTGRSSGGVAPYEDFLQTDAPINRGNSGGALITTGGELVGINSQIVSPSGGNIGIGFAIPANLAKNVMNQLVSSGKVRRGMLGVGVQSLNSDLAQALGVSGVQGAVVTSVEPSSGASRAGIQERDVILRVNGTAVTDSNDLRNRISSVAPGETVSLAIVRDGRERTVSVTLGEVPADQREATRNPETGDQLGLVLERLTPELARRLELDDDATGVVVTRVMPGSTASRAGFAPRDVIRSIDGRPVSTPTQVRDALSAKRDRPAMAAVVRDGRTVFIAIRTQ